MKAEDIYRIAIQERCSPAYVAALAVALEATVNGVAAPEITDGDPIAGFFAPDWQKDAEAIVTKEGAISLNAIRLGLLHRHGKHARMGSVRAADATRLIEGHLKEAGFSVSGGIAYGQQKNLGR